MSDNTKEGFALWGMILFLALPAVAYSFEQLGNTFGYIIFLPIGILGSWLIGCMDDLHHLRREQKERWKREMDEARHTSES